MLKRLPELATPYASNLIPPNAREPYSYLSPLYAPLGNFAQLHTSCSIQTLEAINTMYELTQAFIHQKDIHNTFSPTRHHLQTYEHLLHSPPMQSSPKPDWVHESVRLTALIYTHAILNHTIFANSANTIYPDSTMGNTTLLCSLLNAVKQTDTTNCWGDMRGVFLWVCLIGGAASWGLSEPKGTQHIPPPTAWAQKCFSLWAIKAVVSVGFKHADGMMETLKTGLRVRSLLQGNSS